MEEPQVAGFYQCYKFSGWFIQYIAYYISRMRIFWETISRRSAICLTDEEAKILQSKILGQNEN